MRNKDTQRIVMSGMFIALVYIATWINIPFPGAVGGLVHLGTLVMFVISLKFGKKMGAISGGIGMALFDVTSPWASWAPGTLVIRLLMGYVIGWIAEDKNGQGTNLAKNIIAIMAGSIILLVGYYLYESIFISTFEVALTSIYGNLFQIAIGLIAFVIAKYIPNLIEE